MAKSIDLELPSLQKLQTTEQMELLDVVDSLRSQGLSELVALPQLIVCGDQSSGKSSVLEAISGIPFPRQDVLCTRFATEVILRRASKEEITVSIVPGDERSPAERHQLLQFRQDLNTKNDFKGLFEAARNAMGLSSSGESFSTNVLRVEFSGPSQPQLTLVDLPGLIHSETGLQPAGNVELVHNLVTQYLKNPRSIILAVVSAKSDIGTQIILRKARQVDPQGTRTLGIITKPDTLKAGTLSEKSFLALARNENVKFSLGWHVVKNLDSATETGESNRDEEETRYFKESSFSSIPLHKLGITFLRARLSKVLFKQIQTELPRLVEDIRTQISETQIIQDKLGPSRAKPEQQQEFLISLSQSFQNICRDAVRGNYDHEFFQDDDKNPERRLCATVMNMHFVFAEKMRKDGASWIVTEEKNEDERFRTREEAIKEACVLLKRSRGRELPGLPNPLLVGELFRKYSSMWGELAKLHIENVWEATNRFLEQLLRYITDDETSEKILQLCLDPVMGNKLNSAFSKLDELLEVHKDHPMTTNSQFITKSKKSRDDNNSRIIEEKIREFFPDPGKTVSVDALTRILSSTNIKQSSDMDMVAAEEAFDNMNAFYEVALNLFVDNVPTLAIQLPIIREIPSIFCPTTVASMDLNMIQRIAGESDEKIIERDATLRRLTILEMGAGICKHYARRPQTGELVWTPKAKFLLKPLVIPPTEVGNAIPEMPINIRKKFKKTEESVYPKSLSSAKPNSITKGPSTTNPLSSPARFPESVPEVGLFPNPFSQYLASPSANISSASTPQPSLFSSTTFGSSTTKPVTSSGTSGLFGPRSSDGASPVVNISSATTPQPSLFSSTTFGSSTTKPVTSSGTSGLFGSRPSGGDSPGFFLGASSLAVKLPPPVGGDKTFSIFDSQTPTATKGASPSLPKSEDENSGDRKAISDESRMRKQQRLELASVVLQIPTTLGLKFRPFVENDPSIYSALNAFQSICFMSEFQGFSFEELRLADCYQMQKTSFKSG